MNQNAEHTALVHSALERLALEGYTAWPQNTGGAKTESGGFIKFGKKGSADIFSILPFRYHGKLFGVHAEFEAKTGGGVQKKNQRLHQEFVVERNGGIYIVFRSVDSLIEEIKTIKAFYD